MIHKRKQLSFQPNKDAVVSLYSLITFDKKLRTDVAENS